MYEQVFGLKNRPFTATPYSGNYFPGDSIHHALSQIQLTIERAAGPAIVTGPSGTGKSLLLSVLAEYFNNRFQVVGLLCANMKERRDLLQAILFELRLPYKDMTEGELRLSLIDFLKNGQVETAAVLMLVDEAHSLSTEILDELRLVTNFARNGQPAISIVLAGLPSLEDHLIETKSESLNQRIAARCYLTNLSKQETFDYIVTHLERAGGHGESIFTGDAIAEIHQQSQGCPRVINQICDYSLVLAASQNLARVTKEIANEAWRDLQSIPDVHSPVSPTNEVTSQADDDLMVIEFGQLESDSEWDQESTESFEEPKLFTVDSDEESASNNDFEYQLQSIDELDQLAKPEITANIKDLNPATPFENPFAESFDHEESVSNSFIPAVSEHNLNSLMITSDQLVLLESIVDAEADVVGELEIEPVHAVEQHNDHADLRMTPEALEQIANVESDVRRLQRDLMFTERQFSSQPVHPDYEFCDENQPIEELVQSMSVTEESPVESAVENDVLSDLVDEIRVEVRNEEAMAQKIENMADGDDRDIMIISHPEVFQSDATAEIDFENEDTEFISTGSAKRMDYHELFQQLRSAN